MCSRNDLRKVGTSIAIASVITASMGCAPATKDTTNSQMQSVRSALAEYSTLIGKMQERFRNLEGRVEDLELVQERTLGSEVSSIKNALTTLTKRVPPPNIVPEGALESAEASVKALPANLRQPVAIALSAIRDGKFTDAVEFLEKAMNEEGGGDYEPEILFWSGVAYDGLSDNKNALRSYSSIVNEHKQSPLVPIALMRQAEIFKRLGDLKAYQLTLKKVAKDHPKSKESQEALAALEELA